MMEIGMILNYIRLTTWSSWQKHLLVSSNQQQLHLLPKEFHKLKVYLRMMLHCKHAWITCDESRYTSQDTLVNCGWYIGKEYNNSHYPFQWKSIIIYNVILFLPLHVASVILFLLWYDKSQFDAVNNGPNCIAYCWMVTCHRQHQ